MKQSNLLTKAKTKTTKGIFVAGSGLLLLGTLLATVSPASWASAEDCVRSVPDIYFTSPTTQHGGAGTELTYSFDIVNRDSAGCTASDFGLEPENLPTGWSEFHTITGSTTLAPGEMLSVSASYTSSTDSYPGDYYLVFNIDKFFDGTSQLLQAVFDYQVEPYVTGDRLAPVVNITSPAQNAVLKRNSNVTITATATDNVGVVRTEYKVDGLLVCSASGVLNSCNWKTPNAKGSHAIIVTAYDAYGNAGFSARTVSVK